MIASRRTALFSLLTAVSATAIAACGGGSGPTRSPTALTSPSSAKATLAAANSALGTILVDSKGRTLYLFKADLATSSMCFGACARGWPPLRVAGKPTVGGGVDAALVSTTRRVDGQRQVTYAGHPVYRFAGDVGPGEINGEMLNAFGAEWLAVSPHGSAVSRPPVSGVGGGY